MPESERRRPKPNMPNEAKWIRRIQRSGDREAADQLVSYYYREIYAFVYRQLMHRENALDLTQDIFVSMLRSIGSFEGSRSSLRTWLYRIATNRVIDHFRSRSHRDTKLSRPLEDFDLAEEGDFTLELVRQEEVGRVLELIRTFDIRAQEIIRLKLFAQRTFAEIAQLLELPDSTVKTNYYASIRRIKHQFEEERHEQAGETEAGGRRTADI